MIERLGWLVFGVRLYLAMKRSCRQGIHARLGSDGDELWDGQCWCEHKREWLPVWSP